MKLVHFFIAAAFCVLSGCATTKKYEAKLNTWVGSDINDLITSWGPPAQTYSAPNGNTFYVWQNGGNVATAHYMAGAMVMVNRWCKTTFVTNSSNRILSFGYEGNACKSK